MKKSKLSRESRSCLTNLLPVRARDAALLYVSATEAKHRSSGDDVDGVSTGRGKKAAAAGSERWSILGQGFSAHVTPSVVAYLLACFFCVRTAVDVLRHKSDGESPLQAPDSPIVARCPGNRQHDRVVVVLYNHYVVPLGLPDGAPAATSVGGVIRGETTSLGARHFERCLAIASLTHFVDPAWVGKWANACASLLRGAAAWDSSCVATLRDELERLYKFVKDKGLPWFRSIFSGSISEVVLWNLFQRLALSPFPGGRRTAVSVRNHISNKIREARNKVLVAKRAGEAQDSASPMKDAPKASAGGSEGAGAGRPQEAHLPSAPEEIRRPVELSAAGRLVAEDSATEASRQTADSATQLEGGADADDFTCRGIERICTAWGLVPHEWRGGTVSSSEREHTPGDTSSTVPKGSRAVGAEDTEVAALESLKSDAASGGRAAAVNYGTTQGSKNFLAELGLDPSGDTNTVDDLFHHFLPSALEACRSECPLWTEDGGLATECDALVQVLVLPVDADGQRLRHTGDVTEGVKCELRRGLHSEAGVRDVDHRHGKYHDILKCAGVEKLELLRVWPFTAMTTRGERVHRAVDTSAAATAIASQESPRARMAGERRPPAAGSGTAAARADERCGSSGPTATAAQGRRRREQRRL